MKMTVAEIIAAIDAQNDDLPRRALEEAMARPSEVTQPLLDMVQDICRDTTTVMDPNNRSIGYVIALYLLAQFREPRAYPLAIQALALVEVDMDALFGDMLVEDMARILASVSGGDLRGIRYLIEDPGVDPRVRSLALDALYCLVTSGVCERETIVEYLTGLYCGALERLPAPVWTALVRVTSWLGPEELYLEIQRVYQEGLLVGDHIDSLMEQVESNYIYGLELGEPYVSDTGAHGLVGNTLFEIGGYALFNPTTRLSPEDYQGRPY
ncbi:MAG: DUF1186 domain-containing protein [Acidobacteriota bacterium]